LSARLQPFRKTGKWLDVGCGNGHLLQTVAKDGWDVYGTEYTDEAVEICRRKGIRMQQGRLNPLQYDQGTFDIISSIEVIEHINNFHEELENFNKLLRPGGALYITTPNFNSLSRHLLGDKWSIIEYPEHLCYFTPSTLNRLLIRHGFRQEFLTTSGISVARLTKAIQSENAGNAQDKEEALRQKAENNPAFAFAKKFINFGLNVSGTGEAMKALYIRG
jgi:SAM-dependent methyltransferase